MIAALAPMYIGAFASYRDVLVDASDPRPSLPVEQLLQAPLLERTLRRFDPLHSDGDRRALASQWSKHYLVRLLPPVLAASLVLRRQLPVALAEVQVILDAQGLPEAFRLAHAGALLEGAPSDAFARFAGLIEGHLQPFIEQLAGAVKLSPKVLWSNAGNYLEWFLGEMAGAGLPALMLADGRALLDSERLPDGRRNPLWRPVQYLPVPTELRANGQWRQRRVCCIRYRLEHLGHCDNCPLLDCAPPLEAGALA
ncbi:MAG: Ferric iron reductase protein FhuF [Pseudomonas citronellolis]|nr:MAG: Ferric iron reductase protein FhuF [Pseudomonas citronellolis]